MSNDKILTDDYVAGLLAKDASDCSLKYSAMGMEAFRSDKKPANKPKPNKRFLQHIIKDTDSHNKALLAKEAAESKARLRELERTEEFKRRKTNPNVRDIRRRQMGDIHAILGGKKRPREEDGEPSTGTDSRKRDSREPGTANASRRDRDLFRDRNSERSRHGRLALGDESTPSRTSRRDEKRGTKKGEGGSGSEDEENDRHARRRRDRSRSPGRRRSHSPRERSRKHRHRSPLNKEKDSAKRAVPDEEDDSDPLDGLIGPAPPPRYRGRGTPGGVAGIDRRFSESYDPKTDVQVDNGDGQGDWDDAIEAFRDRQKLKQNQEERMRAAGFATEQIEKVAASGEEKTGEDVRWSKAGEARAWDHGKTVDDDDVDLSIS